MNNDTHLIYEAYMASTDQEYTRYNLDVHQLANKANIRVMLQYVEDELGGSGADPFKKESLIYFLNQLLRNADKVADAIKQVEAKMGDRERMPVAARGEEASEEGAGAEAGAGAGAENASELRSNSARSADMTVANELFLFIQNDEILLNRRYPQYVLNLERKIKRGVYSPEKAVKLFTYLADEASKKYSKLFGDGKTHTADVPTRIALAKMLRDKFEEERGAIRENSTHERGMVNPDLSTTERDQDSSPLKKLVMDLASDFAPVVKDIESSRYSTTQNNYGRYMSLISSMSKGDKKRAEIIAMALITAGANRSGVKSALQVMFGESFEDAEEAKSPKDTDPDSEQEQETDDEREEREREEEQDAKEERELRRRSNNSADRYGGGG